MSKNEKISLITLNRSFNYILTYENKERSMITIDLSPIEFEEHIRLDHMGYYPEYIREKVILIKEVLEFSQEEKDTITEEIITLGLEITNKKEEKWKTKY